MALVDAATVKAAPSNRKKVAILLFDGVQIIDFAGPYEMFGSYCDVYTVAETKDPVTTSMGLTIVPKYSFADAPQPDVLVVPGGGVKAASESQPTLDWVRRITAKDEHTMSVCNGAFILAHAGLLDGLTATTTAGNIDRLAREFPKTKVVRDQRFVDNGKIITTGGLSAGIDGALHVIGKMFGQGAAEGVAVGEEYDWKAGARYTPAMLANREIPQIRLDDVGQWDLVRTEGTDSRWEIALRGASPLETAALLDKVGKALESEGKWTSTTGKGEAPGHATRSWKFTGHDGKSWRGTLELQAVPGEEHHYTAALTVARAG
jgi:putative intracellular protease/amidase